MRLADVVGQDHAVRWLSEAVARDRLPHALLFAGPDGVGKRTLARALAGVLLCDAAGRDACGACAACRRLEHGNHPDFLAVGRELRRERSTSQGVAEDSEDDAERKSWIVVDQIRELATHVGFPPREGRARVVLLDPADRMTDEAQNALLKTLEEPVSRTVLVLAAANPHALLATVRSRCLSVTLRPMPTQALATWLERSGMGPEEARSRAALAVGLPGRALTVDVATLRERRDALLADLLAAARSPAALADLPESTARLIGEDADSFEIGLDLAAALLRDAAIAAITARASDLVHGDAAANLRLLGTTLGVQRSARLVEAVDELRSRLRFHANRTLLAETLLAAVAGGPIPVRRPDL